ncbi:MAG: SDR family oxidoreductase, partial [Flavobacterium sp.]
MKNKIALVTGGSRGLGKDMALNLAKKGLDVIITYNTNREEAEKVVSEIEDAGQKAAAIQLNVEDAGSFESFFAEVKTVLQNKFDASHFDYLVNNAGIGYHATLADTSEDKFDQLVNIHFKGVFFLTQRALEYLNDGGGIVNISSGLARFSHEGTSTYAALKGAVEVLSRVWAKELGARKIRVNTVAPGAIATDFNGGRVRDNEEINKTIAGATALGRAGLPEDIGPVVAFLRSDDARWI